MTTTQLFASLLNYSEVRDPAKVPFDATVEIVGAMNAALAEFYSLAPTWLSAKTVSRVLSAPETITVGATQGSVNAGPFPTDAIGCAIVLAGDTRANQVASTSALRDPYLGSGGSVSATLYGDAVQIAGSEFRRVLSPPRLEGGTQLFWDETLPVRSGSTTLRSRGTPARFCVEVLALGAGGSSGTLAVLRVDPIPSVDTILRVEMQVLPLHLTIAHLAAPFDVPIPTDMEGHLLSLVRWHLRGHPLFVARKDEESRCESARMAISSMVPWVGPIRSRVRTPAGF